MFNHVNPVQLRLRQHARQIFDHALSAVDPRIAVKREIDSARFQSTSPIYSIAIGKAATSMALGLDDALGEKLTAGVLVSSTQHDSPRWQNFIGGHPLPNEASLASARAAFTLLDRANDEAAIVIFLISGGGSAMMEWPINDDVSLLDLRSANQDLVSCGASITEINSVRRAFSAVKGGGLARRSPRARMFTLIVSDTNPGDEASVASGPTLTAPVDTPKAIDVVEHYGLDMILPPSIMNAIRKTKDSSEPVRGNHVVLLDNQTGTRAAQQKAAELGFASSVLDEVNEQPIQEGCDLLLASRSSAISGGEFSCPVRGDGRGGRNLETALRCALGLQDQKNNVVVLSAGTDGIDGNSPAAGAIADKTTIQRARNLGLDAEQYLARSDSYTFFEQLNDLIVTGPTGTNVRDLRILLRSA